ncbi:phage head closure protein [Mesorhizobium sp. DCY119]|uniref:phage head closure protein n=1 Tax=Mesorhizobium sp. DCY119 TaxID=2108445 RepID=UPI000E6CFF75|nr:phage head closure protein [Mesorhizobium sp. DCY119]RJG45897.1 phage head-tail adapter protein [Mesorhizobium sp. DCY119]
MNATFIDPGRLRTELALQECVVTSDGLGGHGETWSEIASVFAMVEPVGAQSVFGAGQSLETVTHRVTIRRRDGVASGMRFVRQERVFEIVTVHDPDETSRYMVCRVREEGR